jgi:DNA-binding transcriptional LysR family regulator
VILVASPTFFSQGLPSTPQELDGVAGMQLTRRDVAGTWLLHAADGRTSTVSYHPRLRCNDAPLARLAAIAGVGVVALPSPLCREDIAAGRMTRVLPEWYIPRGTLSLVFPSQRGMTLAMRATVDFLVDALPTYLND